MNGTQLQTLLTKGRNVNGVSADGVTQVVVRISTNSPGEQFKLTLLNDQQGQSSPNEDGALGNPGDTSFSQNQLTVAAGSTPDSNGLSYAFAVYRAPTDFARPITGGFKPGVCNGTSKTDDQLACRSVSIQVQDITANTNVGTTQITIVRPPLILIHGLWSDYGVWKNFYPLVTGRKTVDRRFYVGRVNYNNRIGSTITATDPALTPAGSMSRISGNSLGFTYNATSVADQIHALLGEFKNGGGTTPVGIAVAAIQVDIIGHSLGGVLARQLVLVPAFLDSSSNPTNNLNQGYIHKIITVGAPHLGSPLAPKLVDSTNYHVREFLEHYGYYSLNSVTFSGQTNPVPGAMAEIKGNGVADASRSSALQTLALSGPRTLPAALVAGNYTNWSSLDCGDGCTPDRIRKKAPNDPLAQSYTSTNYPNNFSAAPSNLNDGIVGITSQLNGPTSSTWLFPGLAHSPGIVGFTFGLGFTAPSELDSANATPSNPIAQTVVDLLNTPVTSPPFSQNSINP